MSEGEVERRIREVFTDIKQVSPSETTVDLRGHAVLTVMKVVAEAQKDLRETVSAVLDAFEAEVSNEITCEQLAFQLGVLSGRFNHWFGEKKK